MTIANPLVKRCYTMSEPHLSGHRVILGFNTMKEAQDAHDFIANIRPSPADSPCQSAGAVAPGECGSVPDETPAARWAANGEPDPHGSQYDCERAALALGDLTDDELANAVFMHGDGKPRIEDVIAGRAKMPIVYLTAAKERIRWLSRSLTKAEAALEAGMQPPSNQPNLICKSCGVDRSKEDCKGDRLKCGLASIAHSDHVAVIGAKTDSVHLAKPVETSTDTSLKTWPERIWLQHGDSPDVPEFSEVADAVTWCVDQIESSDVEYVRADLQSGISSLVGRPNEQNDVVGQEGKQ